MTTVRESLLMIKFQIEDNKKYDKDRKYRKSAMQKRRLYLKQRGKCLCCDKQMHMRYAREVSLKHDEATFEHVIPRYKANGISNNKVLTCNECNQMRGTMDFYVFCLARALVEPKTIKMWSRQLARRNSQSQVDKRMAQRRAILQAENN